MKHTPSPTAERRLTAVVTQPSSPLRRAVGIAALALGLAAPALAQNAPATAQAVTSPPPPALAHFRVMWLNNPGEQAMVSWTTPVEGKSHTVHFDTESRGGRINDYKNKAEALPPRKYEMRPTDAGTPEGWAQNAMLKNLAPSTTYYFVIASGQSVSREFHFVTAPSDDRPLKIIYGGDSRRPPTLPEPHLDRRAVNRLIAELVEQQPDIIAFAHGGDYCSRDEWRFMTDWLSDHELTITKAGRILPIIPARGNHEPSGGFTEVFYWPELDTPYYYSTELSKRVALLTLNTNISVAGDQRDWLEAELKRQRKASNKWIAIQYHRPSYPSVKSYQNGAQQRQHWVPLLEQYQVDIVCEADDHMLKRTVPIYEDKHDPVRGITYIGDGGLGVPQRVPDVTRWYLKSPGFATPVHHVHLIDFGAEEIKVTAIGLDRKFLDQFTLKSKVANVPVGQ